MATTSKLDAYKTEWDLTLLYKSSKVKQIEEDVRLTEKAFDSFAIRYTKNKQHLKNEKALFRALQELEELGARPEIGRPMVYFSYIKELDSTNQEAESMLNKLSDRLTKADNKILFFELELGKIPRKVQEQFLKSMILMPYRYFLENLFESSKYDLSEAEEKILNLKSLTSRSLWIQGLEKVLNKQTIEHDDKQIPVGEAMNIISQLGTESRRSLHRKTMAVFRGLSDFAESELNAIVLDKKVGDELRGYKHPYSGTILRYENDEKSVLNLVKVVTKHFPTAHRFYALKAKLLKLPYLEYADRSTSIGQTKRKIPFKDAVEIVRGVFYDFDSRYGSIFDRFLKNGQIDVFPKRGKTGGAFCSSSTGLPTFVLLNQVDDFHSLSTLAHEMGHAIHSERSKDQRPIYQDYTTSVAETASTLFENILFNAVFKEMSPEEQLIALHDKVQSDIASIFRQIACFNFEHDLHMGIRREGSLSKEQIAALLNKHMSAYMGPAVHFTEDDGYFFVYWSHIRRFFYVYSYAYGELISKSLYEKYSKDASYASAIDTFLSAGGSKKPEDIFKDIGIDTTKPAFFTEGLKTIERDLDKLEKLVSEK